MAGVRGRALVLTAAAASLLLAALVSVASAAERAVTVRSFAFTPARLVVVAGDTITWTNRDTVAHTVTATSRVWDEALPAGASLTLTFTQPGDVSYFCALHPYMTGTVTVVAAGAPPGSDAAPADAGVPSAGGRLVTSGEDASTPFPRVVDVGGRTEGPPAEALAYVAIGAAMIALMAWRYRRAWR